jgi:hypothetical protein
MWTAMVLCVCFLFGRFLLLSWVVAPMAGLVLGKSVDMAQASCAPTRRLDLSNLRIGENDQTFLTTGPVEARYRLWRTLFIGPYVEKLHAQGLTVNLANAPKKRIHLPRFRWFHKKNKEDIEDEEPFLIKDLVLANSTVFYQRDGSPLRLRLEDVSVRLPEMRQGATGRLEAQARIVQLEIGPLHVSSGDLRGYYEMVHDREMDLRASTFHCTVGNLAGDLGGVSLAGFSLVLDGRIKLERGRGFHQDLRLSLVRDGRSLGTIKADGYYSDYLNWFDMTFRVALEPELANLVLVRLGLPAQPDPSLALAVRLRFPKPGVGDVSVACTMRTAGETILDLDLGARSFLPPLLQPARIRVSTERLALDQLLAIRKESRTDRKDTNAGPSDSPASGTSLPEVTERLLSSLSLPPAVLELDLRGVSYGELQGELAATARVQGRHVVLSPCVARVANGMAQGNLTADWGQGKPAFAGDVQAKNVDLGLLAASRLDEGDGRVTGQLKQLNVSFQAAGDSTQELLNGLSGTVSLDLGNLQLEDLKSLRRTAHKYRLDGLRHLQFDQGRAAGRVENGRFVFDEGRLAGTSGRIDVSGYLGLADERLALELDAGLGSILRKQFRRVPKYGYLAMFLHSRDGYAYLPAPIPLGGTWSVPELDFGRMLGGGATPARD